MCRLFLVLSFLTLAASASQPLPEQFYGLFELDHSENLDAYLEAKGYSWLIRSLIGFATFKKEFKKSSKPGKFDYANLTSQKDLFYKDVELGKEFVGEGLDSTDHKITFTLTNGVLYEQHVPTDKDGEAKAETYEFSFVKEDGKEYLLVRLEAEGVVAKRFYKRV